MSSGLLLLLSPLWNISVFQKGLLLPREKSWSSNTSPRRRNGSIEATRWNTQNYRNEGEIKDQIQRDGCFDRLVGEIE